MNHLSLYLAEEGNDARLAEARQGDAGAFQFSLDKVALGTIKQPEIRKEIKSFAPKDCIYGSATKVLPTAAVSINAQNFDCSL